MIFSFWVAIRCVLCIPNLYSWPVPGGNTMWIPDLYQVAIPCSPLTVNQKAIKSLTYATQFFHENAKFTIVASPLTLHKCINWTSPFLQSPVFFPSMINHIVCIQFGVFKTFHISYMKRNEIRVEIHMIFLLYVK